MDLDRLVIGAGMSGLADALHAQRRGARVVVLEAAPVVGGVIGTEVVDGYRCERAASSVPSTSHELRALLDAIGQADLLVPAADAARSQFLLTDRGLRSVPRSPGALIRSDLLGARGKLRALGELVTGRRGATPGETLHAFVRRRFGAEIAERFLRPFTNGIYGCAPEHLGAADAFPRLVALEARRGGVLRGMLAGGLGGSASARPRARRQVLLARDGMASVPRALGAALGAALEVGVTVARLEPGTADRPARVHATDGRCWEAAEVVLAVPASAQADLLEASMPAVAATLRAVDAVPMVVASVGWPAGAGPTLPEGFGFLRGPRAGTRILGATFRSRLDPAAAPEGASLVTAFVGGSEDRQALALAEDELRAIVLADLARALGGPIEPAVFDVTRWARAIPVFAPGHRARMAAANARLASGRLCLLGSHVTGVSLNDCVRPSAPVLGPLPAGLVRA